MSDPNVLKGKDQHYWKIVCLSPQTTIPFFYKLIPKENQKHQATLAS